MQRRARPGFRGPWRQRADRQDKGQIGTFVDIGHVPVAVPLPIICSKMLDACSDALALDSADHGGSELTVKIRVRSERSSTLDMYQSRFHSRLFAAKCLMHAATRSPWIPRTMEAAS